MSEYWEPIRDRGNTTCSIWNQFNLDFTVGKLDLPTHLADVQALEPLVQARDDAEDLYDQAIDARDANWKILHDLNVSAVRVIRGNLEDGDPLMLELDDVSGMPNEGSGRICARSRKLSTLWKKVNTARAAMTPPLDPISVGAALVAAVEAALSANEPKLKTVSDKLASWSSARQVLRAAAEKVDRNNKRWFDAWSGNHPEGSPEREALSQIDTGADAVALPGLPEFTAVHVPGEGVHIDATAEHATHFRVMRKGPGEDNSVERAANAESPINDPVSLPGVYQYQLVARNSSGDGPLSAPKSVTVP
jgi:hypothetical protein